MGRQATPPMIRPLGQPGDLGWVVMAHGEVYAQEFGWDSSFEALVAEIVTDYAARADFGRPDSGPAAPGGDCGPAAAWIAERDGVRLGCVFCLPGDDERTAKLRILLVHPDGRGLGLGARLVDTVIEFARRHGHRRLQLWTNHPLAAARHIYLSRGFELVSEEPHHSFGVDLVGQNYELDLAPEDRLNPEQARPRLGRLGGAAA
jgi:GNAT superfamily N-acetyltransferase